MRDWDRGEAIPETGSHTLIERHPPTTPNILDAEDEDFLFRYAGVGDVERVLDDPEKLARYRSLIQAKFDVEIPEDEGYEGGCERLCREGLTVYAEFWHGAYRKISYKVGIADDRWSVGPNVTGVSMQSSYYAALLCAEAQWRLERAYGDDSA